MRLVELDIKADDGKRYNQIIEVEDKATLSEIVKIARQLLNICHWQKVRIGVGNCLSGWIDKPLYN